MKAGSSPLTRGKHLPRVQNTPWGGLIPAHAGKTLGMVRHRGLSLAHPRSRGENLEKLGGSFETLGSSPLTRGKHRAQARQFQRRGLIPAHAGKTRLHCGLHVFHGAHPRSRGENWMSWGSSRPTPGSSPLTRGKHSGGLASRRSRGLIPAHAGKTRRATSSLSRHRAHPRSRGENIETFGGASSLSGSSPLTRGKPFCLLGRLRRAGLIPAHAGKTRGPRHQRVRTRAHPRSRGENPFPSRRSTPQQGSSPLTRGKRVEAVGEGEPAGLIPAHAGKTEMKP